jgi:hypothetical protein
LSAKHNRGSDRVTHGMHSFRIGRTAAYLQCAALLVACSKSPLDRAIDSANAIATKRFNLWHPTDASAQAERMLRLVIADNPECEIYKTRMREIGKDSPYEATTQRRFIDAQQDACKARCCKSR